MPSVNSETQIIEQTIPIIGKVRLPLHGIASKTYSAFHSFGETARLKNQNLLGAIRLIHPEAHHTRWDYVVFYLYLLRLLKSNDKTLGLNSRNITLPVGVSPTILELLQGYMLLRCFGHLAGSFPAEQVLLEKLKHHESQRNVFLSGFPDDEFRQYAEGIIRDENIWQFHKAISIFFLQNASMPGLVETRPLLLSIFKIFLFGTSQAVLQMKRLHNVVRQIAYMSLDLRFSASEIDINIASILTQPERIVRDRLFSPRSNIAITFDFLAEYLERTIYQSPEAMWANLRVRSLLSGNFRKFGNIKTLPEFYRLIRSLRRIHATPNVKARPLYLKIPERHSFLEIPGNSTLPISREKELAKVADCEDVFVRMTSGQFSFIFLDSKEPRDIVRYVYGGLSVFEKRIKSISQSKHLPKAFKNRLVDSEKTSDLNSSLIRILLYWLTGGKCYFKIAADIVPELFYGSNGIFSRGSKEAKRDVGLIVQSARRDAIDSDRLKEIEMVNAVINSIEYGKYFVILPSRIIVEKKSLYVEDEREGVQLAEFDGAVLVCHQRSMKLFLLESKNIPGAKDAAGRREIEEKISKIDWRISNMVSFRDVRDFGAACEINFRINSRSDSSGSVSD